MSSYGLVLVEEHSSVALLVSLVGEIGFLQKVVISRKEFFQDRGQSIKSIQVFPLSLYVLQKAFEIAESYATATILTNWMVWISSCWWMGLNFSASSLRVFIFIFADLSSMPRKKSILLRFDSFNGTSSLLFYLLSKIVLTTQTHCSSEGMEHESC